VLIALVLALTGGVPSLITAAAPASAASSTYTMTDLGNLGYGVSLGFGINGNGEVVGRSYLNKVFFFPCGRHTCRFTQNDPFSCSNGTMTHLGTFSATSMSEANAVSVRVGLTSDSAADRRSWWVTGSRTMDALYRKRGPPSATLSGRARRVGTFASTGEGFRHLGPLTPRLCGGTMAGGGATRP
jgi:hypothetical protein